jgi:hypothetical protein
MRKQDLKKYIIDFQIKHLNIGINTAEANAFTYLGLEKEQVDVEIAQRNESTIKAVKELISIYCLENKITENFF